MQVILQDNRLGLVKKKSQCHREKKAEKHSGCVLHYSNLLPENIPFEDILPHIQKHKQGKKFFKILLCSIKPFNLNKKKTFFFFSFKKAYPSHTSSGMIVKG